MIKCPKYDAVVIGGGFFGCKLSVYLKQYLKNILILEKSTDLLQRASYVNQARVHNGYHYPRSVLTALRSRISFPRFVEEYRECIVDDFEKYYAVGKLFSKVTANQFQTFCQRISASIQPASDSIKKLFNPHLIEAVFWTQEYAFDSVKLKNIIYSELEQNQINFFLNSTVTKVESIDRENFKIYYQDHINNTQNEISANYVFNCTYSGINSVLSGSNLPTVSLKHELTEMALVDVPPELKNVGITVMCGPFFSIMPFPSRNLHSLSHVRYTPHCYWQDIPNNINSSDHIFQQYSKKTNYPYMIRDATRYLSLLQDCQYVDSIWEVKTVLPQSEVDDSRPILFQRNPSLPNLVSILGGKIDNVYDIPGELKFLEQKSKNLLKTLE
jgi:glycine/D-amino acid oxidase-like deaminating enzyme